MIKILGIETTDSFVNNSVDTWIKNCGLHNSHFINEQSLIDLVKSCIKHDKKFCKRIRDNKNNGLAINHHVSEKEAYLAAIEYTLNNLIK